MSLPPFATPTPSKHTFSRTCPPHSCPSLYLALQFSTLAPSQWDLLMLPTYLHKLLTTLRSHRHKIRIAVMASKGCWEITKFPVHTFNRNLQGLQWVKYHADLQNYKSKENKTLTLRCLINQYFSFTFYKLVDGNFLIEVPWVSPGRVQYISPLCFISPSHCHHHLKSVCWGFHENHCSCLPTSSNSIIP